MDLRSFVFLPFSFSMDGEIRSLSEVLKTDFITEKNCRKTKTNMEFLQVGAYFYRLVSARKIWNMIQFDEYVLNGLNQGTIGCTPNSVPMVFIVFNLGILGDYNP